ncbi:MAG: SufD family Fe-S cluster assembly protein [Nitrososphaerales archaeon]
MTLNLIKKVSQSLGEDIESLEKRIKSFELYKGLPLEPSPLYAKYVDAKIAEIDLNTLWDTDKTIEWDLPSKLGQILYNGRLIGKRESTDVKLQTLQEAKDGLNSLNHSFLDPRENRFTALIQALYSSGHILVIPRDTVVKEPIHLVTLVDRSNILRNIIMVGEGAQAKVVQEIYSPNQVEKNTFHAYSNEILLEEGALLQMTTVQAADQSSKIFNTTKTILKKGSNLDFATTYLGGLLHIGRVEHRLAEEGATAKDTHIALLTSNQVLDLTTNLLHQAPKTNGSILTKVALKDSSKALTKGMIRIPLEGKQSNAYLAQHAIMLNAGASGITIPGLEILTNDVKATHASSISQLDEEQIFYLMSKGLSRENAVKMVTLGFFEHALTRLNQSSVREGLRQMLEDKWQGRVAIFKPIEQEDVSFEDVEKRDMFEGHYKYR